MTKIKSFSVGDGDMFYISHGSDNFTIIDCNIPDDDYYIIEEVTQEKNKKGITRFISTHPDDDHIHGLARLDKAINILNFYCVDNKATKKDETVSFLKYCELRDDPKKSFKIFKDCARKWMNQDDEDRGSSGINILWPDTSNADYKTELSKAHEGKCPNNISCIIKYSLNNSITAIWMGDMESDFSEKIKEKVTLPDKVDLFFAPHHGRKTGKPPKEWLDTMNPSIIVIGECSSEDLYYYTGYNTLCQNSAGDMLFETRDHWLDIFVSNKNYSVDYLSNEFCLNKKDLYYIGSLEV